MTGIRRLLARHLGKMLLAYYGLLGAYWMAYLAWAVNRSVAIGVWLGIAAVMAVLGAAFWWAVNE